MGKNKMSPCRKCGGTDRWPSGHCKPCKTEYDRIENRKRKYSLSPDKANEMLAEQDNTCLICPADISNNKYAVDHDHETLEIRGLLCRNCNSGIGLLQDDPNLCRMAAFYLDNWRVKKDD